MSRVAVFMGSASDEEKTRPCLELLAKLGIDYQVTVTSAHRSPERTARLVMEQEKAGCQVFICVAGMAAHLAGAVAARTLKPVIGIPIAREALAGMDALFSTVQMPPGFPVATMALDKAGACNAAWLAAQILALSDSALATKIDEARGIMRDDVERKGQEICSKYAVQALP